MTEHTVITGNASTAVKDAVRGVLPKTWRRGGAGFGDAIGARLVITEVHILHADGARPRKTARVIVECTVREGNLKRLSGCAEVTDTQYDQTCSTSSALCTAAALRTSLAGSSSLCASDEPLT
jgi:hypothetical protein